MDVLSALSTALTILFGVLSIVFYVKSKRHKRMTLTSDETLVQTRDHPGVRILFGEREIAALWRLRAVCWNSGTDAIRTTDIPDARNVTVTLPENARCLSVALLATSQPEFRVQQFDETQLHITFSFLNPGDWGAFEVLYEADADLWYVVPPLVHFSAPIIGGLPAEQGRYFAARERWVFRLAQLLPTLGILWVIYRLFFAGAAHSPVRFALGLITIPVLCYFQYLLFKVGKRERRRMWGFHPAIDRFLGGQLSGDEKL